MLAASTASALPSSTPCARCSRLPAPPEAITGTLTARDTARVSSTSKPSRVPSRSMLVSRISPAPAADMRCAHCTASSPVARRPPCVWTSQPAPLRLASIATTMHCAPTMLDAWRTSSGDCTAAVLIETLSAPAFSRRRTSATLRTPPPTVSGMNTCAATASMTCSRMSRSSELAVISRKHSSSAPSLSYRAAISTGSPASRRSTKLTPFTTRPAVTSRQGITRLASGTLSLLDRLVGRSLGFFQVELAFVERAAGDGADHAFGHELLADRLNILDPVQTPGSNDWRLDRLREFERGLDVDAVHHAVAADVGIDERLHPVFLKLLREVHNVVAGELRPSFHRHLAFLRIQAGNDVPGEGIAGIGEKAWIFHRRRADDDEAHAGVEVALDRVEVPNAAAQFDLHLLADGRNHLPDDLFILRLAGDGAVQVYHV